MDIATILGLLAGIGFILFGQHLEGGHVGSLLQLPAFFIVFGGTFGAVLVAYPPRDFLRGMKLTRLAFVGKKSDLPDLVRQIVELAGTARRDGLLALESRLPNIEDPFLRKAVQFLVDGVDANVARETLEAEIEAEFAENTVGARVWESAGGIAPTIGILGAVLGLIHVMENLNEPSKLGAGIAVAFVATVYAVGSANLIFIPLSTKIKRRLVVEKERKTVIAEGVLSIHEGLNPRVLEEKLRSFVREGAREEKAGPEAKAA